MTRKAKMERVEKIAVEIRDLAVEMRGLVHDTIDDIDVSINEDNLPLCKLALCYIRENHIQDKGYFIFNGKELYTFLVEKGSLLGMHETNDMLRRDMKCKAVNWYNRVERKQYRRWAINEKIYKEIENRIETWEQQEVSHDE